MKFGPKTHPHSLLTLWRLDMMGRHCDNSPVLIKPTLMDIGDLFQRALYEIGTVKILSQRQAVYWMSRIVATDIVEGRIDPVKGAGILAGYASMADYPRVLAEFLSLEDMPYWGDYAPPRAKLVKDIIEQARLLLDNVPG